MPVRLFQEGFDVWLGNNRGTINARKHTYLDPDADLEYWDFSHHEFAVYDIHSMLQKVVQENKTCRKVSYLGHSLGNL